jgi:D-xylose transport system permease protein
MNIPKNWKSHWQTFAMAGALLVIWMIFYFTTDGNFLSSRNLSILMRQMSVTSILAVGMVLVIVAGQIDLSVGAMTGLLGAVSAMLFVNYGWPLWASFLAALLLGSLLGYLQGRMVTGFEIPPFIVTLGGMLIFQGVLLGITRGVAISPSPDFLYVGQAYLPKIVGWISWGVVVILFMIFGGRGQTGFSWKRPILLLLCGGFVALMNDYEGIPFPVVLMLLFTAIFAIVSQHTPFGRHLYAIGGNREAAFYSGINIEQRIIMVFTLMGFLSGVAGIVLTARIGAASSDAGGTMALDAIAAAVIGGTSLMGGRGTIWGALLGALVMASLDNGMSLMNTEAFWQPIIKGSILVIAVALDAMSQRTK